MQLEQLERENSTKALLLGTSYVWSAIRERMRCCKLAARRPDRCAQTGGAITWWPAQAGLSRRARTAYPERIGAHLSDHHQRCQPSHDSDQSPLSQLGHSLQRNDSLCSAASRMVSQDCRTRGPSPSRTVLSATGSAAAIGPRHSLVVFPVPVLQLSRFPRKSATGLDWCCLFHKPDRSGAERVMGGLLVCY
jgi:hypothetical protein